MRCELIPLVVVALMSVVSSTVSAFEINQTCAVETGCWPGDEPGFPVEVSQAGEYVLTSNLDLEESFFSDPANPYADPAIALNSSGVMNLDLGGFRIGTAGSLRFVGILGTIGRLEIRNGNLSRVYSGIDVVGDVQAEDLHVYANLRMIRATGLVEVQRSNLSGGGYTVGVSCDHCLLEDVTINTVASYTVVANTAVLERVRAGGEAELNVTGAATIIDSTIGGTFVLGDDSVLINTSASCDGLFRGHYVSSMGANAFVSGSSVVPRLGGVDRCLYQFGHAAVIEDSLFSRLSTGDGSALRRNQFTLLDDDYRVSAGAGSVFENNSVNTDPIYPHNPNYFLGFSAGNGSVLSGNAIAGVTDGIVCGEFCRVSNNVISNFSGTAMLLGDSSYYFGNEIDDSGLAGILGGVGLDPSAVGLASPAAPISGHVDDDAGADIFPQLTTDAAGNWVAAWWSNDTVDGALGTDWDILTARSTDFGETWSAPAALNKSADSDLSSDRRVALATDGDGTWLAAWVSEGDPTHSAGADPDLFFARSVDNGVNWNEPAPLNSNAFVDSGVDERPVVASDGNVFLAVWESDDGVSGPDFDLRVARSLTGGASWEPPVALNTNGIGDSADDVHPVLTTDRAGSWLVVWESNDDALGGDGDILSALSTDDGLTWTTPVPVNSNAATDTGQDAWPHVVSDGQGTWVAAWESNEDLGGALGVDRDILFSRSVDNGATWSPAVALNKNAATDSADDANPNLVVDAAGNWTVVWDSGEDLGGVVGTEVDVFIARSTDGGITWSDPAVVNDNAAGDTGGDYNPKIAAMPNGEHVMVVWHSDEDLGGTAGSDWDVFFSALDPCISVGAFQPSTASLAAFQDNSCEECVGVSQPGDDLQSAVLRRANLASAVLIGASLANANLAGAYLTSADLTGVDLSGAEYDQTTVFPSGSTYDMPPWGLDGDLSPWEAGMIPVPEPSVRWMAAVGGAGIAGATGVRRRQR